MMDRITLPKDVAERFARFFERTEICDEEGFTLGYFEPSIKIEPPDSPWYARFRAHFSTEELQRRCQETGGISTAELMAKLRKLPLPPEKT